MPFGMRPSQTVLVQVRLLADTQLELTKALGTELDATGFLGNIRSRRCLISSELLVDDQGVVMCLFSGAHLENATSLCMLSLTLSLHAAHVDYTASAKAVSCYSYILLFEMYKRVDIHPCKSWALPEI